MNLKHFKPEEFACKCGCGFGLAEMDPRLLTKLDEIRATMGRPMKINSAVRCADHNAAIGATEKSEHVPENTHSGFCTAVDIHIPDSRYLFELIKLLFEEEVPRIGYNQGRNFVHVGLSLNHPQNVFFKY